MSTMVYKIPYILLMYIYLSNVRAEKCMYRFQVWTPDQDTVRRIDDLQTSYNNISSILDIRIANVKVQLLQEMMSARNLTSTVELEILQLKLESSKQRVTDRDHELRFIGMQNEITWLKEWQKLAVEKTTVSPELKGPVSKSDYYDTLDKLRNRVGDLKAEWLLIKREVHTLKSSTSALQFSDSDHKKDFKKIKSTIVDLVKNGERYERQRKSLEKLSRRLLSASQSRRHTQKQQPLTTNLSGYNGDTTLVTATMQQQQQQQQQQQNVRGNLSNSKYFQEIQNKGLDIDDMKNRLFEVETLLKAISNNFSTKQVLVGNNKKYSPEYSSKIQKDCDDIYKNGETHSGVYQILPQGSSFAENVYCEMLNGSGWVVIQRRIDGSMDFNKDWVDYKFGFGNQYGEFWAGNDLIHQLSSQGKYRLRVDMWDWSGWKVFADYDNFKVDSEIDDYKLHVHRHFGDAGDSLSYHDGMSFSTRDKDNDLHRRNCALDNNSGWWFNSCYSANLNGVYRKAGWLLQAILLIMQVVNS